MLRLLQIVIIGSLCAAVFAILYGNSDPATVSFLGGSVASGTLGGFLLVAFFGGVLLTAIGALFIGMRQSFQIRRSISRERRMRTGWEKFADGQLLSLLGDDSKALESYRNLIKTTPEAVAALAPLSASLPQADLDALMDGSADDATSSGLLPFLRAKRAESEGAYVRAVEQYQAAFDTVKSPTLLRLARDAAVKAELIEKARTLHQKLSQITKLTECDLVAEANLAALELPEAHEERVPKLRELVRRYPNSAPLVTELAKLEHEAGRGDQAALLLGRAARLSKTEASLAAFEAQLRTIPLERALSVIDQCGKGDWEFFVESKLATLIHHRAISAATDLWETVRTRTLSARAAKLGTALSLLTERKDAAIESLLSLATAESFRALEPLNDTSRNKVVALAPQFSTP
jgi:hypothetical protein